MTRLELDRPTTDPATCWLCSHNYSLKLHIDPAGPDQDLAAQFARVHGDRP